jgi:hypothetical protein
MRLHLCERRETSDKEYLGLIRTVNLFARHPDFPGKSDAMFECVEDIEERSRVGRLSPEQRDELLAILLADRLPHESRPFSDRSSRSDSVESN